MENIGYLSIMSLSADTSYILKIHNYDQMLGLSVMTHECIDPHLCLTKFLQYLDKTIYYKVEILNNSNVPFIKCDAWTLSDILSCFIYENGYNYHKYNNDVNVNVNVNNVNVNDVNVNDVNVNDVNVNNVNDVNDDDNDKNSDNKDEDEKSVYIMRDNLTKKRIRLEQQNN